jgi:carbon-monoxide dehydrogenase medium subunit
MWRPFEYHRPPTLNAAFEILSKYRDEAAIFAGGTDMLVNMRAGDIRPKHLVDVKAIPELGRIRHENGGLTIGSAVTWSTLARSEIIKKEFGIFFESAAVFASPQIRNTATIGGNICRASPSCDMGPPLLVLNAMLTAASKKGERTIPIEEFFVDPQKTCLERGEILREIRIATPPKGLGTAFLKIRRTGFDIALVNVAVALTVSNRMFQDVRIALGSVAPTPIRALKAEEHLNRKTCADEEIDEAAETAARETRPISDLRGSAEYRREVSRVLVKRAVKTALQKVGGK